MKTLTTTLVLVGYLLMGAMPSQAQSVSFTAGSASAASGDQVTIPVTVSGFTDVTTVQFTMSWDPAVLSFSSTDAGALPVNAGNFGDPSENGNPGVLTFSWDDIDGDPTSIADGATIFSVTFDVIGGSGTAADITFPSGPTPPEVTVNLASVPFDAIDGNVSVAAEAGNTAPSVTSPGNQVHTEGDDVSVTVPATDAEDDGFTYSASGLPDGLTIDAASGDIEGTIAAGAASDSPYAITVTVTDDATPALSATVNFSWTVNASSSTVTFTASTESVPAGGIATVAVTAAGFTDVTSTQFTLTWDPSVLSFSGTGDYALTGVAEGMFGDPSETGNPGVLTFAWDDPTATGQSVADGTTLFTITFDAVGAEGTSTDVAFGSNPTLAEVAIDLQPVPFGASDGSVALTAPPAVAVSPASLDYGSVDVGSSSTETVLIESTGGTDLVINSIEVAGSSTYSIASGGDTATLAPGASQSVDVAFSPISAGSQTATLTIGTNAGTETVSLTGTAPEPSTPTPGLAISPSALDFGSVVINGSAMETLTVENTGDAELTITDVSIGGEGEDAFSIASNTCPSLLASGGDCTVEVAFAPSSTGAASGLLIMESNAGSEEVALSGTGEAPPPAGDVTFVVGSGSAPSGGTLTLGVTADSFSNVTGAQFTLIWDPAVLQFVSTGSYHGGLGIGTGNFGTPQNATIEDGTLTFVWDDPDASGKTLADGTTLFTITFATVGEGGTATDIGFADAPTASQVFVDLAEASFIGEDGVAQIDALATIAGTVTYYDGSFVEDATLSVSGDDAQTVASSSDGGFTFDVEAGGDYQLAASKEDDVPPANGVNVNDLSLMRRHILDLAPLGSPYKVIAADVDASENVSVNDISLARQLILGLEQSFSNGLWACATAGQSFEGAPFPFQTAYTYSALSANISGQTFHCFRRADVDASWTASETGESAEAVVSAKGEGAPLRLIAAPGESASEEEVVVLIRARGFSNIGGYQFTLNWDASVLDFAGVEAFGLEGLSPRHFGTHRVNEGVLSTVWSAPDGKGRTLSDEATLFALRFETSNKAAPSTSINFSSDVTPIRAHRGDEALSRVGVEASEQNVELVPPPQEFTLRGNYPNPLKRSTTLALDLPEAATVSVDVYDMLGRRVMHVADQKLEAGTGRALHLDASTLASGSYVYRVTADMASGTRTATGKMVVTR